MILLTLFDHVNYGVTPAIILGVLCLLVVMGGFVIVKVILKAKTNRDYKSIPKLLHKINYEVREFVDQYDLNDYDDEDIVSILEDIDYVIFGNYEQKQWRRYFNWLLGI